MANIDVIHSQMQDARNRMLAQAEKYREEVQEIAAVTKELGSQWEGDAHAAFEAEQMNAMMFYQQMAQRVTQCAETLARSSARYGEADHAAADFIRAANR